MVYFRDIDSVSMYFINYCMFALTSLILVLEYKNQVFPKAQAKILQIKIGFCCFIFALLMALMGLWYLFEVCFWLCFLVEYLLMFANLGYFATFSFDLSEDCFMEKSKESEFLYITTL